MGKTTLLRAFLGRLRRDIVRFSGTSQPEVSVPFLPLTALFEGLGVVRPSRLPGNAELDAVEAELFEAVATALVRVARTHTVVLTLDDVQWIDDATCRLVSFLSTSLTESSFDEPLHVLAVLSVRPEVTGRPAAFFDRMVGGPNGRLVRLDPLDETSIAELVRRLTGRRVSPSHARDLAEATGGNPLLVELVSTQERHPEAPVRMSTSVSDEIARTLRALPEHVASFLEVGALHGDPFDVPVVEDVLGRSGLDREASSATRRRRPRRARRRLVVPPPGAGAPRSALGPVGTESPAAHSTRPRRPRPRCGPGPRSRRRRSLPSRRCVGERGAAPAHGSAGGTAGDEPRRLESGGRRLRVRSGPLR